MTERLLAAVVNVLAQANWQRAGDEHAPQPKLVTPPGETWTDGDSFGSDPIPASEFDEWWDSH